MILQTGVAVPAGPWPLPTGPDPAGVHENFESLLRWSRLISEPFLVAMLLILFADSPRCNRHRTSLICHCLALISYFCTLTAKDPPKMLSGLQYHPQGLACAAVGLATQFSFLASVCWLCVICIDIMRKSRAQDALSMTVRSLVGWGCPLILCLFTGFVEVKPNRFPPWMRPHFRENSCSFRGEKAKLLFFYGPAEIVLFLNLCLSAFAIYRNSRQTFLLSKRRRLVLSVKLLTLNVLWLLDTVVQSLLPCLRGEVAGCGWAPYWCWYSLNAVACLSGVIIFLMFGCQRLRSDTDAIDDEDTTDVVIFHIQEKLRDLHLQNKDFYEGSQDQDCRGSQDQDLRGYQHFPRCQDVNQFYLQENVLYPQFPDDTVDLCVGQSATQRPRGQVSHENGVQRWKPYRTLSKIRKSKR